MDLWREFGVSPEAGLAIAVGLVALAVLIAVARAWRNGAAKEAGLRIRDES
jgi:hypothetical protein